jgi:hypothetical protein
MEMGAKMAPHERGALIERIAKALCRFRHTPRSVEEAVAPGRELWMRYVPDAEVVIEALNLPAPEARDTIAAPREMFKAAMCAVNRDRWASNRQDDADGEEAMRDLHDQMSLLWLASPPPQRVQEGDE